MAQDYVMTIEDLLDSTGILKHGKPIGTVTENGVEYFTSQVPDKLPLFIRYDPEKRKQGT